MTASQAQHDDLSAMICRQFLCGWMLQVIEAGKTGVFTDLTRPPPEWWNWQRTATSLIEAMKR